MIRYFMWMKTTVRNRWQLLPEAKHPDDIKISTNIFDKSIEATMAKMIDVLPQCLQWCIYNILLYCTHYKDTTLYLV